MFPRAGGAPVNPEPTPIVVVIPGASFMDVTVDDAGDVRIACPGCGCSQTFRVRPGRHELAAFAHEDECPVHARIQQAIAEYERRHVNRG
jgi:hypothetical protein